MLLIPFNTWAMATLPCGRYLAREEVLNVVTLGFIGCYGDGRWGLCWRCETRPVTNLGHQEGRRVFWEGPQFFELCPIFSNCIQHIFPGVAKNILRGLRPSGYGPVWNWREWPQIPPRLVSPLQVSLFNITDFYHYHLIPPSQLFAHATEWGPANVLAIGPRTC